MSKWKGLFTIPDGVSTPADSGIKYDDLKEFEELTREQMIKRIFSTEFVIGAISLGFVFGLIIGYIACLIRSL